MKVSTVVQGGGKQETLLVELYTTQKRKGPTLSLLLLLCLVYTQRTPLCVSVGGGLRRRPSPQSKGLGWSCCCSGCCSLSLSGYTHRLPPAAAAAVVVVAFVAAVVVVLSAVVVWSLVDRPIPSRAPGHAANKRNAAAHVAVLRPQCVS